MGRLFYAVNTYAKLYYPFIGKTLTQYIAMCYHKFNEETTVINLTLRPTVNPLPVPNRNAVDLSGSLYMGEYFMLSMHLRQLTRKPARIVIFILILVLLTAFFCVSLNLYANSMYNLKLADETYTTIAIMELYADVDTHGNLIDDITNVEDYAGFHALTVYGYDLEPIVTAPSVIKYDLRARYGAFSDENIALAKRGKAPLFTNDVVRFKIRIEDQAQGLMGQTHSGYELPDDGNFHIASMLDSNKHIGITLMEHNPMITSY